VDLSSQGLRGAALRKGLQGAKGWGNDHQAGVLQKKFYLTTAKATRRWQHVETILGKRRHEGTCSHFQEDWAVSAEPAWTEG